MDYAIVAEYEQQLAIENGDDPPSARTENEIAASLVGVNLGAPLPMEKEETWTESVSLINISGSVIGLGFTISLGSFVWDSQGNIGVLPISVGGGPFLGSGISGGMQFQFTNAESASALQGTQIETGGSTAPINAGVGHGGPIGGFEIINGISSPYWGRSYFLGFGGGAWAAEVHSVYVWSPWFWTIDGED
jgi:hypothetical protein